MTDKIIQIESVPAEGGMYLLALTQAGKIYTRDKKHWFEVADYPAQCAPSEGPSCSNASIQKALKELLQEKTSWGRNELFARVEALFPEAQ